MLFALAMILLVVWMVAVALFHVTGTFVHILLLFAMVSLGWHLLARRRPVP